MKGVCRSLNSNFTDGFLTSLMLKLQLNRDSERISKANDDANASKARGMWMQSDAGGTQLC